MTSKRNSPHIFFGMGVVGVVGGTFLACKATLKLDKVLDEVKHEIEDVRAIEPNSTYGEGIEGYSQREYYRDLGTVYGKSALKLGKLYAPAIAVTGISIAALTGSHVQLTKRNAGLTMALASVTKAYDSYRERVREELGEERELDFYRGTVEGSLEVDGKKTKVSIQHHHNNSPYARCFDETNTEWTNDMERNRFFVKCQQNYANHLLRSRGHVFLNDVYDLLGFERTPAGAVVGWLADGDGDCYIDFGIYEAWNKDFEMGRECAAWLDFNVDGVMYSQI